MIFLHFFFLVSSLYDDLNLGSTTSRKRDHGVFERQNIFGDLEDA
jgi:hypothetical protein